MRSNLPITEHEVSVDPRRPIVSKTDLKGRISYANSSFKEVAGFTGPEIIGEPHNIVRHPFMPASAFDDMWQTLKKDLPWRGIVKNRCKNGDHYWVEAFVTPIRENGQKIGYMSVRNTPSRAQISAAEALYSKVNSGQARLPATEWPQQSSMKKRIWLVLAAVALPALASPFATPLLAVSAIAAIAGGWYLSQSMTRPIQQIEYAFSQLSEGNFRFDVDARAPKEFSHLLVALESMRINLRAIIADVVLAGNRVDERAKGVAKSAEELLKRSREQSDGVGTVAAALEEMAASVGEISLATRLSADHAAKANELATRGAEEMGAAQQATQEVVNVVDQARVTLGLLSDAVREISVVTQTIREIADQTNLLALNAAIEAARAGETGRGFAVVADEVRKLAERTSASTISIASTISSVEARTSEALATMREAVASVNHGTAQIDACTLTLGEIAAASNGVDQSARHVAGMLDQQSSATEEVAQTMEKMNALTEQNASRITGVGQTASQLTEIAGELHQLVQQFEKSL
ncbi:methyl-accepting chemotaxis protein [Iodobacter sp. HSC-16F04]|uniref:Methyl-accepting chemotaxis protein n=1 Tax=Iodobacter violaceini TaxID=3044271 RepID=A0ABX0KTT7_9NEIS|nr:PAS domain-containing methyl-accepting chemotaxis protein [Iodobacter violacea]NHQ88105.1 methyl-accepting chemotaxis protein [Iodobacter violacea]